MKTNLMGLLFILIGLACNSGLVCAQDAPKKAAQAAVEGWVPLWDLGNCDESYEQLAEQTRKQVTKELWLDYWTAVRKPFGKLKTRKFYAVIYTKPSPGELDRESVIVQYKSSFENQAPLIETFAVLREKNGTWRVANYLSKYKW